MRARKWGNLSCCDASWPYGRGDRQVHQEEQQPDRKDDTTRVRQGVTLGAMRWELAGGLVLVVLAFAIAWIALRG